MISSKMEEGSFVGVINSNELDRRSFARRPAHAQYEPRKHAWQGRGQDHLVYGLPFCGVQSQGRFPVGLGDTSQGFSCGTDYQGGDLYISPLD